MMLYAFFVDCILPGNMSEDTVFQSNKVELRFSFHRLRKNLRVS